MLPLEGRYLPANRDEFVKALTLGLERVLRLPPGRTVVTAPGAGYPALEKLLIDVTDATLRDDFCPQKLLEGKSPGITVAEFRSLGRPIRRDQAAINFEISISDARFEFRNDAERRSFLLLADGRRGRLFVQGKQADFLAMILPQLRAAALQQGVTIDNVDCKLRGDSIHSLTFEASARVSKKVGLFNASTTIRGQGRVAIDEHMNLKLSGLSCQGDGMLGAMVASMLQHHTRELESKSIPLTPFSLGRLKLRDLKIQAAEELIVEAALGS